MLDLDTRKDCYPLSPMQQGMLFHSLDAPRDGVNVEHVICSLAEPLDVERFVGAWEQVLARHEVLRTSFDWEDRREPVQIVHDAASLPVERIDWSDLDAAEQRRRLDALLAVDRARGFDLRSAPLMRLLIARRGPASFEVVWSFHHAILDGRSFPIVLREVFERYDGRRPSPARNGAPTYRQFIEWLESHDANRSKTFWQQRLAGFRAPTPLLRSVLKGSGEGLGRTDLRLSAEETERVSLAARRHHGTTGTFLTAAWSLLLARYTGEQDVVFGATRACRRSALDGAAADMVGLFINTLPFRARVSPDTTVADWLAELRAQQLAVRDHEHTPLARVQAWSEIARGTPLFETLLVYEHRPIDSQVREGGGVWASRRFDYRGQTNYPVALVAYGGPALILRLEHDRQRLDDAAAARMLDHVRTILLALAEDPSRRIADVPTVSVDERAALVPAAARPLGIQTFCLHDRFERRAAETPRAPALTCDGVTLTYAQVNRRANQLAHRLRRLGVGPDALVGVHLTRSPDLIVAILGVLKAGGAYLPLDPTYPAERLRFMVDDAAATIIVASDADREPASALGVDVVCLGDLAQEPTENLESVAEPDNLAYVIYTSGSTGTPKGVLVTHANVSRLFDASDIWFEFGRRDVWTLFHSYAFDFSVWEMWGALLYGGRLVIVPYWVSRDPESFLALLERERVTVLNQTPSAFRQLIAADGDRMQPATLALRFVVLGGEALDLAMLKPWFDRRGDASPAVINMFGITETTVHVTYRRIMHRDVESRMGSVIGVPLPDLDVYVLDAHRQLAPIGVTGELYVGGAGVARGYLGKPELTRSRFVPDEIGGTGRTLYRTGDLGRWLPHGELEYRGRIDDQVKIRGFRIELGEVEANLRQCRGVLAAAVTAWQDPGAENRLVAYLTLEPGTSPDEVRATLETKLPQHMVPAAFVPLETLPLTANGKLDRRALPLPAAPARSREYVAPRTAIEQTLASIWAGVLRRDRVGVDDNFFELGGDSILSIHVVSRCRQAGLAVTTRDVFSRPTVAALAAVAAPARDGSLERGRAAGVSPMLPINRWFFEQPFANRQHWNQAFWFTLASGARMDLLERALQAVVGHHDVFRLRFREFGRDWNAHYVTDDPAAAIGDVNLRDTPEEIAAATMEARAADAQSSLDFTAGPTIRLVLFDLGPHRASPLLIVAHHAVIDMVSWRVLLEDLESAYGALAAGRTPVLPPRTTSPKAWAERLESYADGRALSALPGWTRPLPEQAAAIPCDHVADPAWNTEASACTVTVTLDAAETRALLARAAGAHGTHINDLLLAALARALADWTGRGAVLVDLEGHGREDVFEDVDLSRTIGWFTTMYPVCLEAGDEPPAATLKRTRDILQGVHDHGLSYGALRYLSSDAAVRSLLEDRPQARVLFNYLGQVDAIAAGSSLFTLGTLPSGDTRAPENRRSHLLEIVARIVGGRLSIEWIYSARFHEAPTISALASRYREALRELIEQCVAARVPARSAADCPLADLPAAEFDELAQRFPTLADVYPISPTQRLFYTMEVADDAPGFEQWQFELEGPLDAAALERAWNHVIARHPILRTAFVAAGASGPQQVVLEEAAMPWDVRDWRALAPAARDEQLARFLADDRARTFNLARPPLMRATLVRTGEESHRLIWSTHHLLVDGWSWPRIFAEVAAFYRTALPSLDAPCPYSAYVQYVQERDASADERFWRGVLDGFVDPTPLPHAGPADAGTGDVKRQLDEEASSALRLLARRHQVTLGTVVQAAWALVLAHHSGRDDVLFGAAFAGRPAEIPGIETMVGPCVNNLPVRVRVDRQAALGPWLRHLHAAIGELTHFQTTPLSRIRACGAVPAWRRLFDSLVVVQNYTVDDTVAMLGSASLVPVSVPEATSYPATIVVKPAAQLEIKVLRSRTPFGAVAAADDLLTVLAAMRALESPTIDAVLARLPRESHGRANGLASAAPVRRRRGPQLAPRTAAERTLIEIWRAVFGADIGTDENYFELGVHSLALMQAHEQICAALKPDLPISALFQYPTVRELAAHLAGGPAGGRGVDVRARAQRQQQAVRRSAALAKPPESL